MTDTYMATAQLSPPIQTGVWRGWSGWAGVDPFEDYTGPFYVRRETDGTVTTGFRLEAKNMNGSGLAHGGALMTFADYSLFMIAIDEIAGREAVTVNFSADFVGNAAAGSVLKCHGDVIKSGRSLIFARGIIEAEGKAVLSFAGTIKVFRLREIEG